MPSRKRRNFALILTPILGLIIALGVTPAGASDAPAAPRAGSAYVAVIDAGSSGTRLMLYAPGSDLTASQVFRAPLTTRGLSSFVDNPAAAGPDAVQPLLDQLRAHLGGLGIAVGEVPVALLATAGMRRLRLDNPTAVREIFASTRATIVASDLPLSANKILPDYQEALLAWLDANANAGTLDNPAADLGIVEVGGASAQVAFRSPRATGPGVRSVQVSGKDIAVVAISYLGLGANEARSFMQRDTSGGTECFPNNASGTDPEYYLATSPVPVASIEANFRGSPCGRAYTGVVQEVAGLSPRDVRPRNLAKLPGFARASFIGLGAIPFVYADFQIPPGADEKRSLQTAVRTTCKGPDAWLKVTALSPVPPTDNTQTMCSSGSYMGQLFFGPAGIGLTPDRFDAQPDLPGGVPSWRSGYAITVLFP